MTTSPPGAFLREYIQRRPQYERVLNQVLGLLEEYRRIREPEPKLRVHSVRGRVKSATSLYEKASRRKVRLDGDAIYTEIHDIVGVRIVCNTLEGKTAACEWFEGLQGVQPLLFQVITKEDKQYATGYRSRHYLITLFQNSWPTLRVDSQDDDEKVVVEVQIRTILEEGWGEIEHDLVYKTTKKDPTEDPVLKDGFVALSYRLHDADILTQRLTKRIIDPLDDPPRAGGVAKQQRSLSIDTSHLGLRAFAEELRDRLGEAERCRLQGAHVEAYDIHKRLQENPRFQAPRAQRVLWSEIALDRLQQGETALNLRQEGAAACLDDAWNLYEKARAVNIGNPIILLWRQARIRALQDRDEDALKLLLDALRHFEHEEMPPYIRTPFYKAALKTRIGALTMILWEKQGAKDQSMLDEAGRYMLGAFEDHQRDRELIGRSPVPREWMLDNLYVLNNLAFFLLRLGKLDDARATVAQAKETVDPAIWEQDIQFLDTLLAVELEALVSTSAPAGPPAATDGRSDLGRFALLDSLRLRILNILSMPGTYVPTDSIDGMLSRIERFERFWRNAVRAAATPQTSVGPVPPTTTPNPSAAREALGPSYV